MKQQEVFKAMADPTRRAILKRLQGGSLTAGEIGAAFDITPASLSHHFAVLKRADLVRTERRGQYIVYSLNSTVFEDLARMVLDLFPSKGNTGGKK
ncbi:autorepressor SdpR family transcription factor [Rhodanobacter glycinis]|uniref:DNA-binding transcriptional regulator, ArsR family n=1 Tax=Rhodanobacter glycinis TaxID=582702 RepID=A0A1I4CAN9_9GAMM|nr:autorepressor SdpR family transcription factor [Rhodanobacter glycinis]SFK77349.1 DNA-binding transcriptional regulator, ArsR family [Rhodanobacter glycinis]